MKEVVSTFQKSGNLVSERVNNSHQDSKMQLVLKSGYYAQSLCFSGYKNNTGKTE